MDHIEKFVLRLNPKLKNRVIDVMRRILSGSLRGLDIKALKGHHSIFRCRIGKVRIIFTRTADNIPIILDADFRDTIYKRH